MQFDEDGDPVGVERLGIALEPEADYERDPMELVAARIRASRLWNRSEVRHGIHGLFSEGPRIALAVSEDLFHWQRLGLVTSGPTRASTPRRGR